MVKKGKGKAAGLFRILHVTGGMNTGGAETMLMHLYRRMDRSTVQFDFISFSKDKCHYDDEIEAMGGRIFYIPPPKSTNPVSFIRDICVIISKYGPYHAVHAHTLFNSGLALLAARIAGVKIRICHSHNTSGDYGDVLIRRIYFALMRVLIKFSASKKIACTKAAGRFLFGEKSAEEQNFHILYNAVDLIPYRSIKTDEVKNLRKKLGIGEETLTIGHIGKFGIQKNHDFLVKLAEFLRDRKVDFKLLLVGQGNLKGQIEAAVKEKALDGHVMFLGVQTDIPLFMRMFDVFVFPSLYEGLGIVLIEAQAAGTPCVISKNIPGECDMGLGLIRVLGLEDGMEKWFEAVIDSRNTRKIPPETTTEAILRNGYNLEHTVETLSAIYGLAGF